MKKLHRDRLIKLRNFLDKLPSKLYYQDIYGDVDKKGHAHKRASLDCGTPACALGWCTYLFPKYFSFQIKQKNWEPEPTFGLRFKNKTYNHDYSKVAKQFFGITDDDDADNLFGASYDNRTAKEEVRLIDNYLKYND